MGKFGFLTPCKAGFELIDKLLKDEDKEIIILLPDMRYKIAMEEWLISQHKPMLIYLVAKFVTISNIIPRDPTCIIGGNTYKSLESLWM